MQLECTTQISNPSTCLIYSAVRTCLWQARTKTKRNPKPKKLKIRLLVLTQAPVLTPTPTPMLLLTQARTHLLTRILTQRPMPNSRSRDAHSSLTSLFLLSSQSPTNLHFVCHDYSPCWIPPWQTTLAHSRQPHQHTSVARLSGPSLLPRLPFASSSPPTLSLVVSIFPTLTT